MILFFWPFVLQSSLLKRLRTCWMWYRLIFEWLVREIALIILGLNMNLLGYLEYLPFIY